MQNTFSLTHKNEMKRGFSMIELLVVSTIIVVLSAIGLVSYSKANESSRNAKRKADLETVRQALVLNKADTGSYPGGTYGSVTDTLVANGYLSSPKPTESKSGHAAYTYSAAGSCGTGACTFTLTATLEPVPSAGTWQVTNP